MASLRQLGGPLLGRRLLCPRFRLPTPLPASFKYSSSSRSLFTSTPAKKRSSFRSFVARWALAGGLVYCYSRSDLFINETNFLQGDPTTYGPTQDEEDRPPSLLPEKGGKLQHLDAERDRLLTKVGGSASTESAGGAPGSGSPEELEAEADQQGAFNPETGEINWDCPCLGGMAHGPCGEEFKTAFSCFVFSTEDPKGVDCINKFRDMQACFQKHPEVYGTDDEEEEEEEVEEEDEDATLNPPDTRNLEGPPPSPQVSPGSQAGSSESKLNAGPMDSSPGGGAIERTEEEATNKKRH